MCSKYPYSKILHFPPSIQRQKRDCPLPTTLGQICLNLCQIHKYDQLQKHSARITTIFTSRDKRIDKKNKKNLLWPTYQNVYSREISEALREYNIRTVFKLFNFSYISLLKQIHHRSRTRPGRLYSTPCICSIEYKGAILRLEKHQKSMVWKETLKSDMSNHIQK